MKLKILDTTLRDGEQTPGVSLSVEQKVLIASALDKLGVDIIEAGTAIASEGDFKAIKEISQAGLNAEICSFARIKKDDVDAALQKVGEITMKKAISVVKDRIISNAVDIGWETIKKKEKIFSMLLVSATCVISGVFTWPLVSIIVCETTSTRVTPDR